MTPYLTCRLTITSTRKKNQILRQKLKYISFLIRLIYYYFLMVLNVIEFEPFAPVFNLHSRREHNNTSNSVKNIHAVQIIFCYKDTIFLE